MRCRLLTAAALCLLAGCPAEDERPFPADASIPEPIVPTAAASVAPALSLPSWSTKLPEVPASLPKGTRVWATVTGVHDGELPDVGIFTVEGVYDGVYSLTDLMGHRVDGVHPALVHRAGTAGRLVEGTVVLFATKTTPGMLGRVSTIVPGGEINVHYDAGGKTQLAAVDHAEPPVTGVRPMAYVSYPKVGRSSRGLLLATSAADGWLLTSSGHVEIHPLRDLGALPIPGAPLEAGARVDAYAWATGIRPGTIVAVTEPGLRYQVKLDETGLVEDYFFAKVYPR